MVGLISRGSDLEEGLWRFLVPGMGLICTCSVSGGLVRRGALGGVGVVIKLMVVPVMEQWCVSVGGCVGRG